MRGFLAILAMAALACGSVEEKQACSASTECPVGQWCARASGQSRCWADTIAPRVTAVSASCATAPCLRDGVLHVQATVIDDNEVLDAAVSLDLDATRSFPMTRSGGAWVADVPLRSLPFEHFAHDVVATVVARDGARTSSGPRGAEGVGVTRLRWERAVDTVTGLSVTVPAVMADGSVVVGGTNGKVYFVGPDGADAHPALTVGAGQITAAPAVGQHAIWVGSEDGTLYAVELNGSAVIANVGATLGGPLKGSIAVMSGADKDTACATGKISDTTGRIIAASTTANQYAIAFSPEGFVAGPVVDAVGRFHAATVNGTNAATLRTYSLEAGFTLATTWAASVGSGSSAPLGVDASGAILAPSDESPPKLKKTIPGSTPSTTIAGDLAAFALDGAVVLANGDTLIGDGSGAVHRFSSTGPVWTPAPVLAGGIRAPMVLSGGAAPFVVPTEAGTVHALRDDGTTAWQATLPSATALRAGNIYTPPGQSGQVVSYAYFSSGNGRLYSVIVDGQLDRAAPWPKAFHDPRNTNHAGPQP